MKQQLIDGDEVDVIHGRHEHAWTKRPGAAAAVKRRIRRRLRHQGRAELGRALRRRDFLAV